MTAHDREEFHPIANVWPILDDAALRALADDIKANGLKYAIWRHSDGRIIDGRNRWLACEMAGVECPSNTYRGEDGLELIAHVVSLNDKRRHLEPSQRATVAAEIATLELGDNQHIEKKRNSEGRSGDRPSVSNAEAADLVGVGESQVVRARRIKRESPETFAEVKAGKKTINAALQEIGVDTKRSVKMNPKAPPANAPITPLRVVHDSDEQIARQVCHLSARLKEVSEKINPERLREKFPPELLHNLDLTLDQASRFLSSLAEAHANARVQTKNAAS